jgi:Tol biopolymer transport system component
VLGLQRTGDSSQQLWLADTASSEFHAITSGTAFRSGPAASPDGQRIIFGEESGTYDIVSVDLASATVRPLLATERDELMPSWAVSKPLLAYITDRNGPQEIWLQSDDSSDRPLVTARDFPGVTVQWFMGPAMAPQGDRVVYTKVDAGGAQRLWISAVAGGPPVQLTNDQSSSEFPGSWSADGNWFTYQAFRDGKASLLKVKTSGQATPMVVKAGVDPDNDAVPIWSPDGETILLGENLYSADGQTVRSLSEHEADGYVFGQDGKLLYGLRSTSAGEALFTMDVKSGAEKLVGVLASEYRPRSPLNPAVRLSLSPDGKRIAYGAAKFNDNLWMLEGFARKTSWLKKAFGF